MTIVFVLALCIAGFLVGFLALYTMRRRLGASKQTTWETNGNMKQAACLWCGKKGYSEANPSFTCPKCGTVHHLSCWEEYGGCTTWECPLAPTEEIAKVA
ncbi:MAG: DUF2318 domain-containing protein [Chloroflexi bacterium]|nr:DUF2318 domain-containing protein [Chloroflexota bacterium]